MLYRCPCPTPAACCVSRPTDQSINTTLTRGNGVRGLASRQRASSQASCWAWVTYCPHPGPRPSCPPHCAGGQCCPARWKPSALLAGWLGGCTCRSLQGLGNHAALLGPGSEDTLMHEQDTGWRGRAKGGMFAWQQVSGWGLAWGWDWQWQEEPSVL